jgi:hypothetical protein
MSENIKETILNLIQRFSPNPPLFVKFIFLLFALFFLGVIIYFLKKTTFIDRIFLQDFVEFMTFSSSGMSKSMGAFKKIMERLKSQNEDEAKLAIIESDDLLNEVLNKIGYKQEETLGEKLDEVTPDTLPNLKEVIEIHRIRNNIIHDPAYRLDFDEAKRILSVYEQAIQNLESF